MGSWILIKKSRTFFYIRFLNFLEFQMQKARTILKYNFFLPTTHDIIVWGQNYVCLTV